MSIFPYLILAAVTGYIAYHCFYPTEPEIARLEFVRLIPEVFCLQLYGFNGYYATGVSWYLSALFADCFILYAILFSKYKKQYLYAIGPVIILFTYGYIDCCFGGSLNVILEPIGSTFIKIGFLRGLSDMTVGCLAYDVCNVIISQKIRKGLLTIIEIFGYITAIYVIVVGESGYDFIVVGLLALSIAVSFSERSFTAVQFPFANLLGKFSISIYLNHFYWATIMKAYIAFDKPPEQRLLVFFCIVMLTAAANYIGGSLLLVKVLRPMISKFKRNEQNETTFG